MDIFFPKSSFFLYYMLLFAPVNSQILISEDNICSLSRMHQVCNQTNGMMDIIKQYTLHVNDMIEKIKGHDEKLQVLQKGYTEILKRLEERENNIKDCASLLSLNPTLPDGVYHISPTDDNVVSVFCNMSDGGWTVFQRRISGEENFYRNWSDYRSGFGERSGEYWLGNEFLHQLTWNRKCVLRIDMVNWDDLAHYAEYMDFRLDNETEGYRLHIGNYSGDTSDSLSLHNDKKFSTLDMDNDNNPFSSCAVLYTGAWWYDNCHYSNLNGDYNQRDGKGVKWWQFPGSDYMKETVMKLKCD